MSRATSFFLDSRAQTGHSGGIDNQAGALTVDNIIVRKNFAYGRVDRFVVVVHGEDPPTDDVWKEYLDYTFNGATAKDVVRHLVVTRGASPTSAQRKLLQERASVLLDENPISVRAAIVTPSTFARGVVAAISWIIDAPRAFAPDKLPDAMSYLDIPMEYYTQIQSMVKTLQGALASQEASAR
jgi:hypothetical protein